MTSTEELKNQNKEVYFLFLSCLSPSFLTYLSGAKLLVAEGGKGWLTDKTFPQKTRRTRLPRLLGDRAATQQR